MSSFYIREPGGSLIARVSATIPTYYHFDALGSTRLLTDSGGSVIDRYSYDAYGSLISHGSINQPYQYVGQLGYYTHYQEPEFGLLQLGVRFYDTQVGRFTQIDQVHQVQNVSISSYVYSYDSPSVSIDPTGLVPLEKCLDNYKKRVNKKTRDALEKCAKKFLTNPNPKEFKKCVSKIPGGLGKSAACELVACMMYTPNQSEGGSQDDGKFLGYPCQNPKSKTIEGYCQGCAEWNRTKCLCEAGGSVMSPGNARCDSAYKADVIKCAGCR